MSSHSFLLPTSARFADLRRQGILPLAPAEPVPPADLDLQRARRRREVVRDEAQAQREREVLNERREAMRLLPEPQPTRRARNPAELLRHFCWWSFFGIIDFEYGSSCRAVFIS